MFHSLFFYSLVGFRCVFRFLGEFSICLIIEVIDCVYLLGGASEWVHYLSYSTGPDLRAEVVHVYFQFVTSFLFVLEGGC